MSFNEGRPPTLKPIYDPRRAIERVQALQGMKPVRFFAILFPLWDIETTAIQEDGRPYELLEKYIERGIDEGHFHSIEELAAFFGLQVSMVRKILNFLQIIGHVTCTGTRWDLTALGRRSVKEDTKYLIKEKRVTLYFDGFTSKPLLKVHYNRRNVRICSPEEAAELLYLKPYGYRFHIITSTTAWQNLSLRELEARVDKNDYNIPPEMSKMQALAVKPAYIPMYIIETKKQTSLTLSARGEMLQKPYYLVYTGIKDWRDDYFERIINDNPTVFAALKSEKEWAPSDLWRNWLDENNMPSVLPLELADGTWRASLPASTFQGTKPQFSPEKIGDYELNFGYFLQIWCDQPSLRRKAALDRTLKMFKNQQGYLERLKGQEKLQAIQERLNLQARQLQTGALSIDDLRMRATETGKSEIVKIVANL